MSTLAANEAAFEAYVIENFLGTKFLFAEKMLYFMDGSNVPVAAPTENEPYVRFSLNYTYTALGEFGDQGCDLRHGLVIAQIFVPLFQGTRVAYTIADSVEALLRRKTVGEIQFYRAETSRGVKNGNYYQLNVNVEFNVFTGV